ncbi:hypothetical protein [Flavobacterium sp. 5]|uniref:glycosyl-4,4'-diaponeurosporenoate acyltransferase CrtO family protein n=1 Tax=Flavobacterium sp. 5 TaxID=2035199 RepID=UPI000CC05030|nr:hypothetical protein CLU82_3204 [Flavobacterium sp. 5]
MNQQLVYQIISLMIAIYSGLPGLWIAEIIRKYNCSFFYSAKNFEITKNIGFYKLLKLDLFTYCVKNTFFRHCNTKIKITKKPTIQEIYKLLNEITISELCHFFGFIFVLIYQIVTLILSLYEMFFSSILFNTIFNVYPILLQERNKLRLRNFLSILSSAA